MSMPNSGIEGGAELANSVTSQKVFGSGRSMMGHGVPACSV